MRDYLNGNQDATLRIDDKDTNSIESRRGYKRKIPDRDSRAYSETKSFARYKNSNLRIHDNLEIKRKVLKDL